MCVRHVCRRAFQDCGASCMCRCARDIVCESVRVHAHHGVCPPAEEGSSPAPHLLPGPLPLPLGFIWLGSSALGTDSRSLMNRTGSWLFKVWPEIRGDVSTSTEWVLRVQGPQTPPSIGAFALLPLRPVTRTPRAGARDWQRGSVGAWRVGTGAGRTLTRPDTKPG